MYFWVIFDIIYFIIFDVLVVNCIWEVIKFYFEEVFISGVGYDL